MPVTNYSLADFRAEVQLRLSEPSNGGLWSTTELNRLINLTLIRVVMDTRYPKKDLAIPLLAGLAIYKLPDDHMIPEFFYCGALWGNQRVFPATIFQMDKRALGRGAWEKSFNAQPTTFIPFSHDKFILFPPPDTSDTVFLHYTQFHPALVNDTDTTVLSLTQQRLVPLYASYLAQMKNDVKRAVGIHLTEYKKRLPLAVEQQRHNEQLRPQMIVPGGAFDRKNANPEVQRDWTRWGHR